MTGPPLFPELPEEQKQAMRERFARWRATTPQWIPPPHDAASQECYDLETWWLLPEKEKNKRA
jgi:hypothetical protein